MSNKIKKLAQEETAETKAPAHLPVLTVEKDEEPAFSENDQEKAWHELKNAYITKRILIGELIGMEVTPNDNRTVGITYYNGQKVIIPAQELIDLSGSTGKGSADVRRQKLLSSMIGAEISYVIIGLDNNTQTVVASRLKANERNRQTFYFNKDDNGYYKIYKGSIVEARIIGIGESSIREEVFGAECTIHSRELPRLHLKTAFHRLKKRSSKCPIPSLTILKVMYPGFHTKNRKFQNQKPKRNPLKQAQNLKAPNSIPKMKIETTAPEKYLADNTPIPFEILEHRVQKGLPGQSDKN